MSPQPQLNGDVLLRAIHTILDRCADFETKNQFPGEGGERRFRGWLTSDILTDLLGWPIPAIVQGERFDILLQDEHAAPLITIETKTPFHKPSKSERDSFVQRLSAFPTLRLGVLTSGDRWEIFRIDHTLGRASTSLLTAFDLDTVTPHEIVFALQPILYTGAASPVAEHRYRISKSEPFLASALFRLTAQLDAAISDLQRHFVRLFHGLRSGDAGTEARTVLEAIYERWSGESLRVAPAVLARALAETLALEGRSPQPLTKCFRDLGFNGEGVAESLDAILAFTTDHQITEQEIVRVLWPVFEPWVRQLCAQTAHVQLARVLLYRVGEDAGLFPGRISAAALTILGNHKRTGVSGRQYPAIEAIEEVRRSMESLLPSIFKLSEFDWWLVRSDYRDALPELRRTWLHVEDEKYNALLFELLSRLDQYDFTGVDIDVWRNLYENYLPEDERQRLGGFYTPDSLVNLTLDLAEYTSDAPDLCKFTFIDPSCGSGAFITSALSRLLAHLAEPMPCHAELHARNKSAIQKAGALLRIVERNVNAIDIHPFASFLTTLNVLFSILPRYVQVRERDPDFVMEFNIFAWDALDPPTEREVQSPLFARMNARNQRGEHDYDRYRTMIDNRFHRVIGNPPWGGVLKGPLAPVYDMARKRSFKIRYPSATQGKYDIYGLFLQRAINLLRPGGKLAVITQATYIEKEWASGLRALLASETVLNWIVDLNPFGHLFFRAMNAPCITVATLGHPSADHTVHAILSARPKQFGDKDRERRQDSVTETLRRLAQTLKTSGLAERSDFASGVAIPQATLQAEAQDRWNLARTPRTEPRNPLWYSAGELLEVRQGVTPGNALDIFLLDQSTADHLQLEPALVHRAIKSRDLDRWSLDWHGRVLLYPYVLSGKKPQPAFRIDPGNVKDTAMSKRMTRLGLKDALDFDIQIDDWEQNIVRQSGINKEVVARLLKHRIARDLVAYPRAAAYLCGHYPHLYKRVFEHKAFTSAGKAWYEFHRPRDPKLMMARQRIMSPTLVRSARFVLDTGGYLSDHACLFLQPTKKTAPVWKAFTSQMELCLRRKAKPRELLLYCLAFLNSSQGSAALIEGRRPTPKGSFQVSEQSLREIWIAPPHPKYRQEVLDLISTANKLVSAKGTFHRSERSSLEETIDMLVDTLLART